MHESMKNSDKVFALPRYRFYEPNSVSLEWGFSRGQLIEFLSLEHKYAKQLFSSKIKCNGTFESFE